MNYRHAFHAGNFADVVKHAVLARLLVHLCAKPAAYRAIDTHAGAGLYDLAGPEAARGGEWHNGIERVLRARLEGTAAALLGPYLEAVAACNPPGRLTTYRARPRSCAPSCGRRIAWCWKQPNGRRPQTQFREGPAHRRSPSTDGRRSMPMCRPERRGPCSSIRPSGRRDFSRLAQGLEAAHHKWPNGTYLLWYPIKAREQPDALARRLRRSGTPKILRAEVGIAPQAELSRLSGCGLIVVNPPWTLEPELQVLLPALAAVLADTDRGSARIHRISGEF